MYEAPGKHTWHFIQNAVYSLLTKESANTFYFVVIKVFTKNFDLLVSLVTYTLKFQISTNAGTYFVFLVNIFFIKCLLWFFLTINKIVCICSVIIVYQN